MRGRLSYQPLKTKIRNFSKNLSNLYHIPEVITTVILLAEKFLQSDWL